MKTTSLLYAGIVLSFSLQSLNAMLSDEKGLIEINGQKKYMIGHIMQAQLDAHGQKENPFFNTDIIRYVPEEKTFIKIGGVLTVNNKDDLEDINNNNYVYTPFYTLAKTAWSFGQYVELAALIIGTKNIDVAEKLHFAATHLIIDQHKKSRT